jgi:hypothetical protein
MLPVIRKLTPKVGGAYNMERFSKTPMMILKRLFE